MPVQEVPDFYGHTIFCDDIRAEADGKFTYVGVYASHLMIVHSDFPKILPKFCMGIVFNQRSNLFTPNLTLRVVMPGDDDERPSIEGEIAGEIPKPIIKNTDGDYTMFGSNIVFSPFTIEKPGRINVRLVRNGTIHRLGSMKVMHISEVTSSNAPT